MPDTPENLITDLPIVDELQDSYLTYAMSVIMAGLCLTPVTA